MDLEQLAALDEIVDGHRLEPERLRLASALGLVPVCLPLDRLGKPGDQLGNAPRLVIGQASVRDCDCTIRLAVDSSQDNAIGIDDPISTWHRFHRPGLGKTARGAWPTVAELL